MKSMARGRDKTVRDPKVESADCKLAAFPSAEQLGFVIQAPTSQEVQAPLPVEWMNWWQTLETGAGCQVPGVGFKNRRL